MFKRNASSWSFLIVLVLSAPAWAATSKVPPDCQMHGACFSPTLKASVENPHRAVIVGQTNLPDGTELLIGVERKQTSYRAQAKVTVKGGGFRSSSFSQGGEDLNPGTYIVEVTMPLAQVQPASVQAVIGRAGEKLTGPLVRKGLVGPTVEYKFQFQNGGRVDPAADQLALARQRQSDEAWAAQSCHDVVAMTVSGSIESKRKATDDCIAGLKAKRRKAGEPAAR